MELKLNKLDKKHIIIISLSIISIIIGSLNVSYAFFKDSKSSEIILESASSFGTSTIVKTNVVLEGELNYITNKNQGLNSISSLALKYDDVTNNDYLISLVAQSEPLNSDFLEIEGSLVKYEVFHKNDVNLDTSNFQCTNNEYNNGINNDFCQIGTFENKIDGTPFEMLKDYRIKNTDNHYFDVYIYLINDVGTKKIKVNFSFLTMMIEKETYKQEMLKGSVPDLSTGLIPVVYDSVNKNDTGWFVADTSQKWYSYTEEEQWWANAVSVDSTSSGIRNKYVNNDGSFKKGVEISSKDMLAMFVWIPRYSYTIGCTDINNDGSINTTATTDTVPTECLGYKVNNASDLSVATPGAIDIKFVSVDDDIEVYTEDSPIYTYTSGQREPSNYYTHPAFDFGGKKLSGLWVAKFEPSVDVNSSCYNVQADCLIEEVDMRILPNVTSLRADEIYNQYIYSQYFTKNLIYGLTGDSHMMKNDEWSAVTYLTQSIYGKYGNSQYTNDNKEVYINNYLDGTSNTGYITGTSSGDSHSSYSNTIKYRYNDMEDRLLGTGAGGAGASTTGNIYGIYDMNGGANEYVMGWYAGKNIEFGASMQFDGEINHSGFTNDTQPNNKYYNRFTTSDISKKSTESIGGSLAEINNWYNDKTTVFSDSTTWLIRGGTYSNSDKGGIFYISTNSGYNTINSFRITLVK